MPEYGVHYAAIKNVYHAIFLQAASITQFGKELGAFMKTLKMIRVFVSLRCQSLLMVSRNVLNWRENDLLVRVPRLAILPGGFLTMTKRISSRYS